jgi:MFS transporter, PAT family, beta-lactamase induction signal transducer AmpG
MEVDLPQTLVHAAPTLPKRIVFTWRVQLLGLLSIPSGMPLGWVFNTFQVFLVNLDIPRAQIGLLSAVSLPWTLKFLWAPLVDRYALPWPGRRRSWVIITQLGLALAFGALAAFAWRALGARAAGAPLADAPLLAGLLALTVAFLAATQDIAYDAYAVELLRPEEHGAAPGVRSIYYRFGMLLAGAVAIGVSDQLGWPLVFLGLGALFVASVGLVLVSPAPEAPPAPPRSLGQAVVQPFQTFFRRPDAIPVALFLIFYKFGDNMAGTMVNPFLKDLCFSNTELGAAVKTIGLVAAMVGSAAAAGITLRAGVGRALWIFGACQALANLLYAATALSRGGPLDAHRCGLDLPALDLATRAWAYAGIAAEQGAQSMASVAQGALLLRICDRQSAVTQFALLSSLFAVGRWTAGLPSGYLVEGLGYPLFFTLCATVMAVPGFILLQRVAPFGQRDVPSIEAAGAGASPGELSP